MQKNRSYYDQLFASYPDVITVPQFRAMLGGIGESTALNSEKIRCRLRSQHVPQFRAMLGGIGESTALKLLHEKRVQHYFIRGAYLIPKKYVVDYVLSTHYYVYRTKLKARI